MSNLKKPNSKKIQSMIEDIDINELEKQFENIGKSSPVVQVKKVEKPIAPKVSKKQQQKLEQQKKKQDKEIAELEKQFENIGKQIKKITTKAPKLTVKQQKEIERLERKFESIGKDVKKAVKKEENVFYCGTVLIFIKKEEGRRTYKNHSIIEVLGQKYIQVTDIDYKDNNDIFKDFDANVFYSNPQKLTDFINIVSNETSDEDLKDYITHFLIYYNIDAFKIVNKHTQQNKNIQPFNILKQKFKYDASSKFLFNAYIDYKANLEAETITDLIVMEHCSYVKKNFRPNSCFLTAIINKFYGVFNERKSDGKRRLPELTYQFLCELFRIPNTPSDNEIDLETALIFFNKYDWIGLSVYSPYKNLLYKKESKVKERCVLRVIAKDGHIYQMNDNLKSLEQIAVDYEDDERDEIFVSDKYNFLTFYDPEVVNVVCNTDDEILNKIKDFLKSENKSLHIITALDVKKMLMNFIRNRYQPQVYFHRTIHKIVLKIEGRKITIEKASDAETGSTIDFDSNEVLTEFNKASDEIYQKIAKEQFLSYHHSSVQEIEDAYNVRPVIGQFKDININEYCFNTVDKNKAYSSHLAKIKQVPIFSYFDIYEIYDNHDIEDLTYYIVEVTKENKLLSLLFNGKYSRVYGFVLKLIPNCFKILHYRRPSKIVDVDFETPVNDLFKNDKLGGNNKFVANRLTGLLEQKKNKGFLTKIFLDINEAHHYAIKYLGKLMHISDENNTYYIVNIKQEKRLVNGLSPIKDIIYLKQRIDLFDVCKTLARNKIPIYGVKTDCVYYSGDDETIQNLFPITSELGDYKIEYKKNLPFTTLQLPENELVNINDLTKVTQHTLKNERDETEMNDFYTKHKRLFIRATYPGSGKSYGVYQFMKNKNSILTILPINTTCRDVRKRGFDAITFHRFFSLDVSGRAIKHKHVLNLDQYECIFFDEVARYEPWELAMISKFADENKEKYIFCAGDMNQIPPIGFDDVKYLDKCLGIIFNEQLMLEEMKRCNSEDAKVYKNIMNDIFVQKLGIKEISEKYSIKTETKLSNITTQKNLAYFNQRCKNVSEHIHTKVLKHKQKYIPNVELICKKYYRKKDVVAYLNYSYKFKKIQGENAVIYDDIDDEYITIPKQVLDENFILPYCITIDACQGMTIDEEITIFDLQKVDVYRLWVALTRSSKLSNITVFLENETSVDFHKNNIKKRYFEDKITNYKEQDKKAKREYKEDEFITEKWIQQQFEEHDGLICKYCKQEMKLEVNEFNKVVSDVTVDRIDSKLPHIKSNCTMSCLSCNIRKNSARIEKMA